MNKDTVEDEFAPVLDEIAWLMVDGARTHRKGEWREHAPQFHIGRAIEHPRGSGKMAINDKITFSTPHAAC